MKDDDLKLRTYFHVKNVGIVKDCVMKRMFSVSNDKFKVFEVQ